MDVSKSTKNEFEINLNTLTTRRWNQEYANKRYTTEPSIPFTQTILDRLEKEHEHASRTVRGLYVGCGNGRNYVPITAARKLDNIVGIDSSDVAISQIQKKHPKLASHLVFETFEAFESDVQFDYIIAIQVFQHGVLQNISRHFDKVKRLLRQDGLFFLRVNSATTDIYYKHKVIEREENGGFTITYEEGPKRDLNVHFFSRDELLEFFTDMRFVSGPGECSELRKSPKTGTWSQWESVLRKVESDK